MSYLRYHHTHSPNLQQTTLRSCTCACFKFSKKTKGTLRCLHWTVSSCVSRDAHIWVVPSVNRYPRAIGLLIRPSQKAKCPGYPRCLRMGSLPLRNDNSNQTREKCTNGSTNSFLLMACCRMLCNVLVITEISPPTFFRKQVLIRLCQKATVKRPHHIIDVVNSGYVRNKHQRSVRWCIKMQIDVWTNL